MAVRLSSFATRLVAGKDVVRATLSVPLLVWEVGAGSAQGAPAWMTTGVGAPLSRPRAGEPLVYELKKGNSKQNAFAMGITVGRTENNDVILDDASVSRFHAYLQHDEKTGSWRLVDADSSNGTFIGTTKLSPSAPATLRDRAKIRFGSVEMWFFEPDSFFEYLVKTAGG